jgi:hypothetical protein
MTRELAVTWTVKRSLEMPVAAFLVWLAGY